MLDVNDHFSMHYEVEGRGIPLLLLHGFTGSVRTWDPFVVHWNSLYKIIRVDIVGHGKSQIRKEQTDVAKAYSMEAMSKALSDLLVHLGVERAAILGYSMGARLALYFSTAYPKKVLGLLLESGSPGLMTEGERVNRSKQDEEWANQIVSKGLPSFVNAWAQIPLFSTQKRLPKDAQARIRQERLDQTTFGLAGSLRGMGTGAQPSLWGAIETLDQPVMIIVGEWDDKFITIGKRMAAGFSNAVLYIAPEAGHAVHVEQIGFFVKIVKNGFYNLLLESNT